MGQFSLFEVSMAELQYRIDLQWPKVVAAGTSHRKCFAGLEACDTSDTRRWLDSLDVADQWRCFVKSSTEPISHRMEKCFARSLQVMSATTVPAVTAVTTDFGNVNDLKRNGPTSQWTPFAGFVTSLRL